MRRLCYESFLEYRNLGLYLFFQNLFFQMKFFEHWRWNSLNISLTFNLDFFLLPSFIISILTFDSFVFCLFVIFRYFCFYHSFWSYDLRLSLVVVSTRFRHELRSNRIPRTDVSVLKRPHNMERYHCTMSVRQWCTESRIKISTRLTIDY